LSRHGGNPEERAPDDMRAPGTAFHPGPGVSGRVEGGGSPMEVVGIARLVEMVLARNLEWILLSWAVRCAGAVVAGAAHGEADHEHGQSSPRDRVHPPQPGGGGSGGRSLGVPVLRSSGARGAEEEAWSDGCGRGVGGVRKDAAAGPEGLPDGHGACRGRRVARRKAWSASVAGRWGGRNRGCWTIRCIRTRAGPGSGLVASARAWRGPR